MRALLGILLLAMLAGSLLAFSGPTAAGRDDGSARTANADRSAAEVEDTATERTAVRTGSESMERTRTKTDGQDDTAAGSDGRVREADRETEKERMRTAVRTNTKLERAAWNATAAGQRCAREGSDESQARCLLRMANASLYEDTELEEVDESELQCTNASSVRARVACRLELPKEEQKEGLYYLPEECRNLTGQDRRVCLSEYDAIQPCRFERGDDARFKCVRERIGLNASAKELVAGCKEQRTNDSHGIGACVAAVRARVFEEAKFRIYNLEEKAGRLSAYGVSNDTITGFVAKLEEYKTRFVAAEDVAAKKEVLAQVEAAWKEFVQQARAEAQQNRVRTRTEAGASDEDASRERTENEGANESAEAS